MKTNERFTQEITISLSGEDIANLLSEAGIIPEGVQAEVNFNVPGGGDWSNTKVLVSESDPITVGYTVTGISPERVDVGSKLCVLKDELEKLRTAFGKYIVGHRPGEELWSEKDQEAYVSACGATWSNGDEMAGEGK